MIVLDTHAWIWWLSSPKRIPSSAKRLIDSALEVGGRLYISAISVWELAMLVDRGRVGLSLPVDDWIATAEGVDSLEYVPIDNRIALRSVNLANFPHRDPADRIIVATTVGLGATLITADEVLHSYQDVSTAWR